MFRCVERKVEGGLFHNIHYIVFEKDYPRLSVGILEFREQSLQAEQVRFEVGSGTAIDVARAQRDLAQSRIAEIQARIAYRIAKLELFRADGSLLERRGIALK